MHEVGYLEKPIFEMHEFPEYIAEMGHDVGFLDFPETSFARSSANFGQVVSGRVLSSSSLKLYSHVALLPGILGRLIAVVAFPFFFHRVLADFEPDVVVSFAVPTSGWQAAIICKLRNKPLLFRALDVSHKIRRSVFAPLIKLAEKIVYSNATWVSCNNPAMLRYCVQHGSKPDRSSVELPPLNLSHFFQEQTDEGLRDRLGVKPGSRVVLYMGSFFYFSGLDDVLRQLASTKSEINLVLIGGGEQETQLRALTKELLLDEQVKFTGFIDFAQLPSYLAEADVAINPMVPSLVANKALPNKVLQYMASGLPVVTTKLEGLSSLFPDQEGIRYVSQSSDVISAAIAFLHSSNLKEIGESNRAAVANRFDSKRTVKIFEERIVTLRLKV